jgi:hypothetical protein
MWSEEDDYKKNGDAIIFSSTHISRITELTKPK